MAAPRRAVRAAHAFVAAHGKPSRAVVEPLGRAGARVVLVGADGALGDVIVPDMAAGTAVCDAVADLEAAEWDRDTTAAVTIGAAHRRRMAGPRARR
ncbi:hypothetical protein GTS_05560 [Gandjariella thermophila]|uniref:Uncharacterized protein n=1 Tax=Gandjariella thermophila TaxID=1931992 RepID=A0A4D4J4P6_9PSEU|nr:hypothetical protein GTS_05560 [Gandjariella thermophila]